ncbi:MAG: YaaR family protein [Sporomusaceae bacterium]|nr:YaaR family protein [Sporomusaceae bacterium]
MKINPFIPSGAQNFSETEASPRTGSAQGRFMADLAHSQGKLSRSRLDAYLQEITAQGQRLTQTPTYAELKSYRTLISKFLGEAVGQMYTVDSQAGWDRHGRQKMYTTIKRIDTELAELTEDIRQGQERQLNIAGRMDIIRGLLIDLYT